MTTRRERLKRIEEALDNVPSTDMILGRGEDKTEFKIKELYYAVRLLADDMKEGIELEED